MFNSRQCGPHKLPQHLAYHPKASKDDIRDTYAKTKSLSHNSILNALASLAAAEIDVGACWTLLFGTLAQCLHSIFKKTYVIRTAYRNSSLSSS